MEPLKSSTDLSISSIISKPNLTNQNSQLNSKSPETTILSQPTTRILQSTSEKISMTPTSLSTPISKLSESKSNLLTKKEIFPTTTLVIDTLMSINVGARKIVENIDVSSLEENVYILYYH